MYNYSQTYKYKTYNEKAPIEDYSFNGEQEPLQ